MSSVLSGKINNIALNTTSTSNAAPQTALIKTAGGAVYKVPITALQGKSVGQQIIIKTGPSGSALTTTAATIISMNTMTTTSTIGKTVTNVVSSNANATTSIPGMVIRSVVASPATAASPGQKIQIIRPVTPVTLTTNAIPPSKATPIATQIRLSTPVSAASTVTATPNNSSNASTPTTASTPLQQFIQIPLRLPDGRTQTINLPLSMITGNQQVQIALNQTTAGSQVITVTQPRPQLATATSTATTQVTGQNVNNVTTTTSIVGLTPSTPNNNASSANVAINSNVASSESSVTTTQTTTITATTVVSAKTEKLNDLTGKSLEKEIKNLNDIKTATVINTQANSTSPDSIGPPAKRLKIEKLSDENLASEVSSLKKEIKEKQVLLEKQLYKDAQFSLENLKANSKISTNNHNSLPHITNYGDCKVETQLKTKQEPQMNDVQMQEVPQVQGEEVLIGNETTDGKGNTYKESELYCLCRKPYDETKVYVGCDSCLGWFHCSCVGITEQQAEEIDKYFCPDCQKSKE